MKHVGGLILTALLATAPAAAEGPPETPPALALARVLPGKPRIYFIADEDARPSCPNFTPACRERAYVVPDDLVLIDGHNGAFIHATFATSERTTSGWLPADALRLVPVPAPTLKAWQGFWGADEASIDIKPGKRPGSLALQGMATSGTHDPERVRRGGINFGDFEEEAMPAGDLIALVVDEDYECQVKLRLIGPYLSVIDNNQCGGVNVSFTGIYRVLK